MISRRSILVLLGVLAIAVAPAIVGTVRDLRAYETYSTGTAFSNCAQCHEAAAAPIGGGFQSRLALHDAHVASATGTCARCHVQTGDVPPMGNCMGCHGQPNLGGEGLRWRHERAGVPVCTECHALASPAPENIKPTYYGLADILPTDPCNADGKEDFWSPTAGAVQDGKGLDNDGDLTVDAADTDCRAVTCVDRDGDGFGSPSDPTCPGGNVLDCNDNNNTVYPGAPERFDALDNDCDSQVDEIENDGFFSTTNRNLYSWNAQLPTGQAYDVIRSDGAAFPGTSPNTACVADNTAAVSFQETVGVPPGRVFFFLVRNSNVGDYGKASNGTLRVYGPCP